MPTSPNACVVNVAVGGWYPQGQDRLVRSLEPGIGRVMFRDAYPPGSPEHGAVPYGFKPYAFQETSRRGFRLALWLDASCWAIRSLEPLFDCIERDGYVFWRGGWTVGEWCKDDALAPLGITREEAFSIPLIAATAIGLDLSRPETLEFLDRWRSLADDGVTFPGPWTNANSEASAHKRVLGHRHDQTAASVLAHRMGFKLTDMPEFFAYWSPEPDPKTLIVARGGLP